MTDPRVAESARFVGWRTLLVLAILFVVLLAAWCVVEKPSHDRLVSTFSFFALLWVVPVLAWLATRESPRRWIGTLGRPFFPLASFSFAYVVSVATLIAFGLWIFIDAEFGGTVYFVGTDIGLWDSGADPAFVAAGMWDLMSERAHEWNSLGPRIIGFFLLLLLGGLSFVVVGLSLLLGRHAGRTIARRWAPVVGLSAAWLALVVGYDELRWQGVQWRVRRALPRFEAAAVPLLRQWPKESGSLPEAGPYFAYPVKMPNTLLLPKVEQSSTRETFGMVIERAGSSGLRFSLAGSGDCQIEYHAAGAVPATHTDTYGYRKNLIDVARLRDKWFLVRYKSG